MCRSACPTQLSHRSWEESRSLASRRPAWPEQGRKARRTDGPKTCMGGKKHGWKARKIDGLPEQLLETDRRFASNPALKHKGGYRRLTRWPSVAIEGERGSVKTALRRVFGATVLRLGEWGGPLAEPWPTETGRESIGLTLTIATIQFNSSQLAQIKQQLSKSPFNLGIYLLVIVFFRRARRPSALGALTMGRGACARLDRRGRDGPRGDRRRVAGDHGLSGELRRLAGGPIWLSRKSSRRKRRQERNRRSR